MPPILQEARFKRVSPKVMMSLPHIELVAVTTSEQMGIASASGVEASLGELAAIAEVVLEDHAGLQRAAARLRELCVALRTEPASADLGAEVLIEEFEDLLIPHFAAEQAEEFFGSLVTEEPRLLQRVERLQAEHGEMAEALDRIAEFARTSPPGPVLATRLTRLLDAFDTHERAENALMQEFLLLDKGGDG